MLRPRLAALGCLLSAAGAHAQTTDDVARARGRGRGGAWAGPALAMGALRLRAPSARIDTRLDAVPGLSAGLDLWPEERLGVYLGGTFGAGADLDVPGTEQALRYNVHQLEAGGRHRWHLGARADAPALFVALGGRLVRQDVQVQRPTLLVSSTVGGPELGLGGELPTLQGALWLRATLRGEVPFFVRERPADSGDPRRFLGFGGRAEAVLRVTGAWAAQATVDHVERRIGFAGEGTRAAGVREARTLDRLTTLQLGVRHAL